MTALPFRARVKPLHGAEYDVEVTAGADGYITVTPLAEGPGRPDGLTAEEGAVMDALVLAVERFGALPRQHPDELRDFVDGIHRCQYLLALRVARSVYPAGWPVKKPPKPPTSVPLEA